MEHANWTTVEPPNLTIRLNGLCSEIATISIFDIGNTVRKLLKSVAVIGRWSLVEVVATIGSNALYWRSDAMLKANAINSFTYGDACKEEDTERGNILFKTNEIGIPKLSALGWI